MRLPTIIRLFSYTRNSHGTVRRRYHRHHRVHVAKARRHEQRRAEITFFSALSGSASIYAVLAVDSLLWTAYHWHIVHNPQYASAFQDNVNPLVFCYPSITLGLTGVVPLWTFHVWAAMNAPHEKKRGDFCSTRPRGTVGLDIKHMVLGESFVPH